ncbi:MAG: bifunctional demethylmenaquinone methyltransferase/2-methoxy-6-polyprenyl-1,4-benzoquinol methylase UbiE [Tannerellaceae bacterium]|jgi:demethylmenaquinone methyltransferase/2-methoxy-6-polyprenyl-1,4-benzoquinol methylase|nr:bifunctional demethylmenaquinone methyltransferase/2-methoxy-6-polyprenyl-1,4-benzoquinol methylase UbiE [Tannerellaceae bacterium]
MEQLGAEKILPYNNVEQKGKQVERMFNAISVRYDLLNHTLSLGFDKGWRRKGIRYLKPFCPNLILDIATGTGDLAISMHKTLKADRIIGADISEGMMQIGREKAECAGYTGHIRFEKQDCLALTYQDNAFDAVTVAFGVRNFADINKGLAEMYRVLSSGGHVMILELSSPVKFPMKQLYKIYSALVIPQVGRFFSKDKRAYHYLPDSIKMVPQGKEMQTLLEKQGFTDVQVKTFTGGICSLYTGVKK